jgi:hypothetical protein
LRMSAQLQGTQEAHRAHVHKFSKVLGLVTLYSKYTKALTFENLCEVRVEHVLPSSEMRLLCQERE